MNIAIIPARSGSKRIPGKNIKKFSGKPMIEWPINAALKANIFDKIIVSTDSEDIAKIALAAGAEVPFIRPSFLADDYTPTAPVLLHALDFLEAEGNRYTDICCIYTTTPFLSALDLRRGLDEMRKYKAPASVSVTTYDFPVLRAFKVEKRGEIAFNWPEYELARSQDLPEFYHDAGQFYWLDAKAFRKSGKLLMPGARPVVLPRKRVIDLDTQEDWEVAELMAKVFMQSAADEGE